MISNQCFTVFFPSSLMTVPFSCPIMEATWTWSRPWQSREMNWRVFRKREGKITIASVSVPVVSFPTLSPNNGMYTMCWNEKHSKSLHTLVVYICCTFQIQIEHTSTTEQIGVVCYLPGSDFPGIACSCCCHQMNSYEPEIKMYYSTDLKVFDKNNLAFKNIFLPQQSDLISTMW